MQKISLLFIAFVISFVAMAQTPEQMSYQGVARNAQGQPIANTTIGVRIRFRHLTPLGTVLYTHEKQETTNAFGLFTVKINDGTAVVSSGNFSAIYTNPGAKFLETEIDPAGGTAYVSIGTTPLQSVPFALMSKELELPYTKTQNSSTPLLDLSNTGSGAAINVTSATNHGLVGESTSGGAHAGVRGVATGTGSAGVRGSSSNASGVGVDAVNTNGGLALNVNGNVRIAGGNTSPGAGKVLTSDASGNASWQNAGVSPKVGFSVYGIKEGGLNVLPNSTFSKIHFGTEAYDKGNDYNVSATAPSSTFTVPVSGFYAFNTNILFDYDPDLEAVAVRIMAQHGTTGSVFILAHNSHNGHNAVTSSVCFPLTAGDLVWVEAYAETQDGSSSNISDNTFTKHTRFSGYLIFAD